MTMEADYLELSDVRVVFDGFVAVDGVTMTVLQRDLRFLIGPNGAGKTTLIDAITGLAPATGSSSSNTLAFCTSSMPISNHCF